MRALLSVYDKTGVVDLARGLAALGWDLVASSSTAAALRDAGLAVTDTVELTGYPAILGDRVKTLHPKVHGGLLADRSNPHHLAEMEQYGIDAIDLVVSNLYPFASDPSIELIDIGGPAMVRSAAKNHAHVGVVVDPADYGPVLDELRRTSRLSDRTRRRLAGKAFATTSSYDDDVTTWLEGADASVSTASDGPGDADEPFPATLKLAADQVDMALRYGENPHQRAALYRARGSSPWWAAMTRHAGMELSYLNLFDADAAWALVHDIADTVGDGPVCAIVKHANPCGVAVADTMADAYQGALECDPRSAFGGIVALSRPIDTATVELMVAGPQADVVIAPGYGDGVVEALVAKRRNTRLLEAPAPEPDPLHLRPVTGGFLVQDPHHFATDPATWLVVTARQPTEGQLADAVLAFRICGWVRSNSVVLVRGGVAWGIGAGQQNRVEAGQIATQKAAGRAAGGACASDAFYPFPDGIDAAADAGVAVVVQPGRPGGSGRDAEIIARADELDLAMVFTGERHFLH